MADYFIEDIYKALEIISSYSKSQTKVLVALNDAIGRYSFSDIYAPANYPAWRRSRMDGYACNSRLSDFSKPFSIVGDLSAADTYIDDLKANECVRIATGAKVPDSADVVIRLEDSNEVNDILYLNNYNDGNDYIEKIASKIKEGNLLIKAGQKIDYRHIEILATLRINNIYVNYMPKVGILSTGAEITDRFNCENSIINSNFYGLSSLLDTYDIPYNNLGICDDNIDNLEATINDAIDNFDVIISFGGTAYSRYDLMKQVIKNIGGNIIIDGLKSNPAKTFRFGIVKDKPIFIFPGTPEAAIICAELFLLNWILSSFGKNHNKVISKIKFNVSKRIGFYKIIPTLTTIEDGILCSYDRDSVGEISNAFRSLIIIDDNIKNVSEGNFIETILIYYM